MILVAEIQRATAQHYRVPLAMMSAPDAMGVRHRDFAWPRQMAMLLARRLTRKTYPNIARSFHRDHSTIITGVRTARRRCLADRAELQAFCAIRASLSPISTAAFVSALVESEFGEAQNP